MSSLKNSLQQMQHKVKIIFIKDNFQIINQHIVNQDYKKLHKNKIDSNINQ